MSKEYNIILDTRIGSHVPKKFLCPNCNKKTFVRFIERETLNYLGDTYGFCDREQKCGYKQRPEGEVTVYTPAMPIEPAEPSYHSYDLVSKTAVRFKENNLIQFLKTIFPEDEVKEAIINYCIGTSKHWEGSTVFWQIDNLINEKGEHNVRGGKIMQYVKETGKRFKNSEGQGRFTWVHTVLKLQDFNLSQCLFGLHMVKQTNKKTVALVESEKTAIIMSLIEKDFVWLATGGSKNFKYEMLKPIKGFNIIAFPDKGEFQNWNKMAMSLNTRGFKIVVADNVENTDYPSGTDLADIAIKLMQEKKAKPIIDFSKYTSIEKKVYNLEQDNPALRLLIETFDLTDEFGREIRKIG